MEEPFTNREIREMFGDMKDTLVRVEMQVTKTNGRVTELEKWRYITAGGMAVIVVVLVPMLTWALSSLVDLKDTIREAVKVELASYDVTYEK